MIDSNFEATKFAFHEHFSFKSNLNGNVFKEKCYVILGFNLPEEDSYNFFVTNWKELTGRVLHGIFRYIWHLGIDNPNPFTPVHYLHVLLKYIMTIASIQ